MNIDVTSLADSVVHNEVDEGFYTPEDLEVQAPKPEPIPKNEETQPYTQQKQQTNKQTTPKPEPKESESIPTADDDKLKPSNNFESDSREQLDSSDDGFSIKPLVKEIFDRQGWAYRDEVLREDSIEGLIGLLDDIVVENSVPQYASELTRNFDEYVKRGGDPRVFVEYISTTPDPSKLPMRSEEDKVNALRLYYRKTSNRSDQAIERTLEAIKARGIINEELQDAMGFFQEEFVGRQRNLVQQAETERQQKMQAEQRYDEELRSYLGSADHLAGYDVNKAERQKFYSYISQRGRDGLTQYQRDLNEDPESQIHLAYLKFKGVDKNKLEKDIKKEMAKSIERSLSKFSDSTKKGSSDRSSPTNNNNNPYNYNFKV